MEICPSVSRIFFFLLVGSIQWYELVSALEDDKSDGLERFKIDGYVERPSIAKFDKDWFANTRIYTSSGHSAFLRENGSFVLNNMPSGAHFIHVDTPNIAYAPVRVDINSKGKWRVRKFNILQPSKVDVIAGPLKFTPLGPIRYFQAREQWPLTDMLFNPMVLVTVVPLILLLLLPKLSDADTRKEVEAQLQMPKAEGPDLSEFMTNLFKGGSGGSSAADGRRAVKGAGTVGGGARGGRWKEK